MMIVFFFSLQRDEGRAGRDREGVHSRGEVSVVNWLVILLDWPCSPGDHHDCTEHVSNKNFETN